MQGLIYRFSFLMVFTLLCAALTVILFIIGNVNEGHWKWEEPTYLEYTSAVQTGLHSCINPLKGRSVNWLHFAIQV